MQWKTGSLLEVVGNWSNT